MTYINKKVRVTFINHIRRGILHGLVIDEKEGYIYLEQFTEEKTVLKIKNENVKEIFVL